ncbi:MAG: hypothetical protein Greene071421_146 [Parcubacteria group bacterium Greene0714_21]|nr:MAG: hypothetical protein Greene041639_206 [Parcubacteria group bacterium Greene0416_39]TSC98549.1 MAG: hypothetical protein Greene101447_51 [Parcubacteria group bacterium Greene1014_47]TSD04310.1 MAG: hypothetical protein Greene071421_146 [Parcubacteria group bacterium Greene0714_21]
MLEGEGERKEKMGSYNLHIEGSPNKRLVILTPAGENEQWYSSARHEKVLRLRRIATQTDAEAKVTAIHVGEHPRVEILFSREEAIGDFFVTLVRSEDSEEVQEDAPIQDSVLVRLPVH